MANASKLTNHKFLIFDVYATLADWETGLYNALKPLFMRFPSASRWSRADALRTFITIEEEILVQHPSMLYSDVLAKAHEVLETRLKAVESESSTELPINPSVDSHKIFGNSIKHWNVFSDSVQALRDLSSHFKLIVLSNVDHASFAYTHAHLSGETTDNQRSPPIYTRPSPNPIHMISGFPNRFPTLILHSRSS